MIIHGKGGADEDGRTFLHRGIASRQFQRNFILAEGIEVMSASLEDGLLNIDLVRPIPEPQVRKIKIEKGKSGAASKTIDLEPNN